MPSVLADTAKSSQADLADAAMSNFGRFGYASSMKARAPKVGSYAPNRIGNIMSDKNLTLEAVAGRIPGNVHHTTVDKLVKQRMGLTLDWMLKLSAALEVDPCDLIREPVPSWKPSVDTIEELLAAVVLSDEGDLEQRAAIRAAAQAVHAALTKLAADSTNEHDRGYLRAVCDDVRQAMTASPIPPYVGKSRTKARKADTRENSQP